MKFVFMLNMYTHNDIKTQIDVTCASLDETLVKDHFNKIVNRHKIESSKSIYKIEKQDDKELNLIANTDKVNLRLVYKIEQVPLL